MYAACLSVLLGLLLHNLDVVVGFGKTLGLLPKHDAWVQARIEEVLRQGENVPEGAILLIGDSIIEHMDAAALGPDVHNLGIASLTALTMAPFLPQLRAMRTARAVVLEIGGNDLGFRPREDILRDYAVVVATVPPAVPLIVIGVLPMNEADPFVQSWPALRNANINALNISIRQICAVRPGCTFLWMQPFLADAAGNLRDGLHAGDGRHLSAAGNRRLTDALRATLARTQFPYRSQSQTD